MPPVLDWQRLADPHSLVQELVRRLAAGQVIGFPTDTTPCLAASGLSAAAVERLASAGGDGALLLQVAVLGVADARDWVPGLPLVAQRLGRRFWPGPLTLVCRDGLEQGVLGRLAPSIRQLLCPDSVLRLTSPGHPALLEVLGLLAGPLLLGASSGDRPARDSGADVMIEDGGLARGGAATQVEVAGTSWRLLQAGVISEETLRRQSTCLIVFVCTGNTCRSPLAEALCKKRLSDRLGCRTEELPDRGYTVVSAGLAAAPGAGAADEARVVAESYGADLSAHQSRPLTPDLAAQADYLVTMTRGHVQAMTNHYARLGSRPRLLSTLGDDIADPIGQHQEVYGTCGRQIWEALETLVTELLPQTRTDPPSNG